MSKTAIRFLAVTDALMRIGLEESTRFDILHYAVQLALENPRQSMNDIYLIVAEDMDFSYDYVRCLIGNIVRDIWCYGDIGKVEFIWPSDRKPTPSQFVKAIAVYVRSQE